MEIFLFLLIVFTSLITVLSTYNDKKNINIIKSKNLNSVTSSDDEKYMEKKTHNYSTYIISNTLTNKIRKDDPYFNVDNFANWCEDVFINLYDNISANNINFFRNICSDEFYNYLKNSQINDIKKYIGIIDNIDYVNVENIKIIDYCKDEKLDYEICNVLVTVILIKEPTSSDEQQKYWNNIYKISFKRSIGYNMGNTSVNLNELQCPNCAAPIEIENNLSTCEYCGKSCIVDLGDWKICNIQIE